MSLPGRASCLFVSALASFQAIDAGVVQATVPPLRPCSAAAGVEFERSRDLLAPCLAMVPRDLIGDAHVTFHMRTGKITTVVTRGIPARVRTCLAKAAAQIRVNLGMSCDPFDTDEIHSWVPLGDGRMLLPPVRDLLDRRSPLPPMVERERSGCLLTDRGPSLDGARAKWMKVSGEEVAMLWADLAAHLSIWPRALGTLDSIFVADGTLVLSGNRNDGRRAICLKPLDAPAEQALSALVEREGTCWTGALKEILLRPNVAFPTSDTYLEVSVATRQACAVSARRRVVCCGHREGVVPDVEVRTVRTGEGAACALDLQGHAVCWGPETLGRVPPPAEPMTSLSVALFRACGTTHSGSVVCWGPENTNARPSPSGSMTSLSIMESSGIGLMRDRSLLLWSGPATLPVAGTFAAVDAQADRSCAVSTAGVLSCWDAELRPAIAVAETPLFDLSLAVGFNCGLRGRPGAGAGPAGCWRIPDKAGMSTPGGQFRKLSASRASNAACGVRADGSIACWGDSLSPGAAESRPVSAEPDAVTGALAFVHARTHRGCGRGSLDLGSAQCHEIKGHRQSQIGE